MLFDDTYRTLENRSEGTFRDRGSKFIGYAFPVSAEQEVKQILAQLRDKHPKARHFCWALRLTPDRSVFKINDDGEPSGSAARPILNVLLSADLTNVLLVVVRYFGGTLLGVPGLINAYKTAANEAIAANEIVSRTINERYQVSFGYLETNAVMRIIKDEKLSVLRQDFDSTCTLEIEVRKADLNTVLSRFEKIEGIAVKYLHTIS